MTTIAARSGIMACDSAWSDDGKILHLQSKITRTKHGLLIGGAGDCSDRDIMGYLSSIRRSAELPTLSDLASLVQPKSDLSLLIYFPDRELWLFDKGEDSPAELYRIESPYFAIGSGRLLALVAMDLGCSAVRAVEVACTRDNASRLPVHHQQLKPVRGQRTRKRT